MKSTSLLLIILLFFGIGNSQKLNNSNSLKINQKLVPQEIEEDGKPELEYLVNNKTIALDGYDEIDSDGKYLRMKFNGREVILKMNKQKTSKLIRVYSNNEYTITFSEISLGKCSGEGGQYINGKMIIQLKNERNTLSFKGYDPYYSSKKCQDVGND